MIKAFRKKIHSLVQSPQQKRHSLVGPAKLWKMKQDFQFNFLKKQELKPESKFLDIGCGTLRGGIPLIKFLKQGNYYGIEVRKEVLEEGKKELQLHHLRDKDPTLLVFEKFEELEIKTKFDVIWAFSVLIHLNDQIAENCFSFVSKQLNEEGSFFANVNIESAIDGQWQGFPVVFRSLDFYEKLANKNGLRMIVIGELSDLGHNSGQVLADKQVMLKFLKN